jgi:DNA-binding transcriptional ArsR family regulator
MDTLAALLGSRTRAEIFRLLFQRLDAELYLREIHRRSGVSIRPIQQELNKLSRIGLVTLRNDGNRVYYRANASHPLAPEIRSLVEKTSGVPALLEAALTSDGVEIAFIFGSVAAGTAQPASDLDLFLIGDLGLRRAVKSLSGVAERIGREINPHVMTREEFSRKVRRGDHFVSSVMKSTKTFVIGSEDELAGLGQE